MWNILPMELYSFIEEYESRREKMRQWHLMKYLTMLTDLNLSMNSILIKILSGIIWKTFCLLQG